MRISYKPIVGTDTAGDIVICPFKTRVLADEATEQKSIDVLAGMPGAIRFSPYTTQNIMYGKANFNPTYYDAGYKVTKYEDWDDYDERMTQGDVLIAVDSCADGSVLGTVAIEYECELMASWVNTDPFAGRSFHAYTAVLTAPSEGAINASFAAHSSDSTNNLMELGDMDSEVLPFTWNSLMSGLITVETRTVTGSAGAWTLTGPSAATITSIHNNTVDDGAAICTRSQVWAIEISGRDPTFVEEDFSLTFTTSVANHVDIVRVYIQAHTMSRKQARLLRELYYV
jgi:hypothetical protein